MNTLDTNVLVRFLVTSTKDDEHTKQQRQIASILVTQPSYIPVTIILELVWVLKGTYHLSKETIAGILQNFLAMPHFTLENAQEIRQACDYYLQGMDFADALHLLKSSQSENFYTFDKNFINKATKLTTLPPVIKPTLPH